MVFPLKTLYYRIPQLDTVDFGDMLRHKLIPVQPSGSTLPLTSEPFE